MRTTPSSGDRVRTVASSSTTGSCRCSTGRPRRGLFDLKTAPTERRNLAATRLDKMAELSAVLAEHERQMVLPSWPSLIEAPIPVDRPLGVPPRSDDEYVTWAN